MTVGAAGFATKTRPPLPDTSFRAFSTDPFWSCSADRQTLMFREVSTDAVVMQSQLLPDVATNGVRSCRPLLVVARVALGRGSDGMSDRIQPDVAEIPIYGRR